jgi:drug/metabolite transporter (DMT)-like permease
MTGSAYALISAMLFGASAPLAKILLSGVSPWLLAGILYLGSGIGLACVRLVWRGEEAGLARADLPWLAAAIAAGGIVGPVLLMLGLTSTAASEAALLLNLEGVLTLGIAWVVFKEYVDFRLGMGAAAIVLGALILSWPSDLSVGAGWGPLCIGGACLAWAVDNNLTRKVSAADPIQIAMIKGLVAGSVNVILAVVVGTKLPDAAFIAGGAVVGFLGYGVSLSLFVMALRLLGTARTGAYFSLAPFIGAGIAILLLGDRPTIAFFVAGALMAIGLWIHLTERHQHVHQHEPLEHDHLHVHDEHHRHRHPDGNVDEPHSHVHMHDRLTHKHPHYPDLHHRHSH